MRNIRKPQLYLGFAALLGASAASTQARVLLTEVLANEVGSTVNGEWAEIMNTALIPVDVSDYKFGDEETLGGDSESGGMFKFPANTILAPGQIVVIANSAERFNEVYGFKPTFEAFLNGITVGNNDPAVPDMVPYIAWLNPAEAINMANTNDQAILLAPDDTVADALSWGNSVAFTPGINTDPANGGRATLDGQSYFRLTLDDTDTAADWGFSPDGGTAASRSTPGVVAVPEPAGLSLLAISALALGARRRRD